MAALRQEAKVVPLRNVRDEAARVTAQDPAAIAQMILRSGAKRRGEATGDHELPDDPRALAIVLVARKRRGEALQAGQEEFLNRFLKGE